MDNIKISILTSTYNRKQLLPRLYQSIQQNLRDNIIIEWLIMDDGSTDGTESVVKNFESNKKLKIIYKYQENSGKMVAINNLVEIASGELMVECDSDDYFFKNAFEIIRNAYLESSKENDLYGLCFLKSDIIGNNIGNIFKKKKTTMFDLYFKELENGEKSIVFISKIRKKYKYQLEKEEKFVTEARLYHKMDLNYFIKCYNKTIMVCEYQEDGYTKNILKQFKKYPYGYYQYFKEILEHDMNGVAFEKKLYAIKHYILFSYLTKQYTSSNIKNFSNKVLYYMLFIPGIVKSFLNYHVMS